MRFYRRMKNECVAKKFAFLPFTIENETRWLEMVYYERADARYSDWFNNYTPTRFITKEEYKKRRYL